ncbi:MAG TPA: type IV pilus biogenesis/stability protein PilW [Burkholderiales bacterium]|nr:type IV pilus biogenesis/stability protein PilW [Burkholderiales bacterium]
MNNKNPISAALSGLLLYVVIFAGCQSTNYDDGPRPGVDTQQTVADEGQIMERADGRTRAKVHTELASAYYGLGNMGVALEETRVALTADPTYPPAYNIQGLVSVELRDNALAEQSFKKGLQLAPDDADLNHNYGWFLCRTNRDSEAIPMFMNAIKNPLYQTPARTYAAAGNCLHKKNPQEAAGYYDRALRLEPNSVNVLLSYADLQYQRGLYGEAQGLLAQYNRLIAEPPAEALWLALRLARKQSNRGSEASYAAQLQRRFPKSPQAQALQRGEYD